MPLQSLHSTGKPLAILFASILLLPAGGRSQAVWDGGAGDNLWGSGQNWSGDVAPVPGTASDLLFDGNVRLAPANNYTAFDDFRNLAFSLGSGAFVIGGNAIDLFGKIENGSQSTQTVNLTIGTGSVSGGFIEMNPVIGNLTVGGTDVFLGNNQLRVWGNNGKTLTFGAGTILSGAGGSVAINQNSTVVFQSAHSYTGGTFINAGKLSFAAGGSANSSTLNLLDTTGAANAALELTPLTGGISLSSPLVVRSGSAGAAVVNSLNTSGSNTLSGALTLDRDLTVFQETGGRLNLASGGAMSGAGKFIKTGGGEVAITANINSPGGGWEISAGKLISNGGRLDGGNVTINSGGIYQAQTGGGDSVGNSRSVTVASGGAFDFQQASVETIASLSLSGSGAGGTGALVNSANTLANLTPTGGTTLAGSATIGVTLSTAGLTLNNAITGAFPLTKVGSGNLTLASASPSFSGGLTVTAGTVTMGGTNNGQSTAGTGTLTIGSGASVTATAHNIFGHTADANIPNVVINGGTLTPYQYLHMKNIEMTAGTIANGGSGSGAGGTGLDMSHDARTITTRAAEVASTIDAAMQTSAAGIGKITFIVEDGAAAADLALSGAIVGGGGIAKSGSGTLVLSAANGYSGATTVNAGTVLLSGASGAIANTALTLGAGATLKLENTAAANNGNRIGTGAITMNGAAFNYSHTAGAANYSETAGALSVASGTNTVATSQAAGGQTSTLTFASLARTGGWLNFSGTGLGTAVDATNEVRFSTAPTLTNGIIGHWATVNGTDFATVTGAGNSVVAYSGYADVDARGPSTISDGSTTNVRINGDGTSGSIALGSATTTINSLVMNNASFAATVDTAGKTLAVDGILVGSGRQGLTIGAVAGDGFLQSATAGGSLLLNNQSANGLTVNAVLQDNTSASGLTKSGSGKLTLAGTNTFTGITAIQAGILSVATIGNGGTAGNLGQAASAAGNLVLDGGTLQYTGATAGTNRGATVSSSGSIDIFNSGTTLTVSGALSGAGTLTKTGAGKLEITSTNNPFTGSLTVSQGEIFLNTGNNTHPLGTNAARTITISAGATLTAAAASHNPFGTGAEPPLVVVNGTMKSAEYQHMQNIDMTGGTISPTGAEVDGLDMKNSPTVHTFASGTTSTIASKMSFNSGTVKFNIDDGAAATDLLVSGLMVGSSGLNKTGPGTLSLTATNTYSGNTTVDGGILDLAGGGGASGTIRGTVTVNSGAVLRLSAGDVTGYSTGGDRLGVINLNGGTMNFNTTANQTLGNAAVNLTGGSITGIAGSNLDFFQGSSSLNSLASAVSSTISGPTLSIRQTGGLTITTADGAAAADLAISSVIRNEASFTTQPLIKAGAGTLVLSGDNSYTGATIINAGTLSVSSIANGSSNSNLGASSAVAGNLVLGGGTLQYTGATVNTNRAFTLTNSTTSTIEVVGAGTTLTISGASASTTGSLAKTGAGTLSLGGANAYTGDTAINGGTLLLGASNVIADSSAIKLGGGTLATGGSSDSLGTLQLLSDSVINLTGTSVLSFVDSSAVSWTAAKVLSIWSWTGSLAGGGAEQLNFGVGGLSGGQVAMVNFVDPAGLPAGTYGARLLGSGELVPVPEPGAAGAGIVLLAAIGWRGRRAAARSRRQGTQPAAGGNQQASGAVVLKFTPSGR